MSQIFHPDALSELFDVDETLVPNLIEEFRTLAPKLIQILETSLKTQDFRNLELHSHSLKSSAKLLGFNKMAEFCLEIELSAGEKTLKPFAVSQLMPCFNEAIHAIDDYMHSRKAS